MEYIVSIDNGGYKTYKVGPPLRVCKDCGTVFPHFGKLAVTCPNALGEMDKLRERSERSVPK